MAVRDDLQWLIADLDRILSQSSTLFDGLQPSERESIAAILERVRQYLASQQDRAASSGASATAAQQIAQAVLSRLDRRLSDWFELLQSEVEQLRQQRQLLIAQMQQQQQQHQQSVTEELEVLAQRCNEAVQQKLSQIQSALEQQSLDSQPSQLEQFERLQEQSNRLLLSLDSSFRSVFATLEKDLQGYYDSLCQGLERMHSLGQQGEAKFLAYVRRLTQQIEGSSTQSLQSKEAELAAVMRDLSEVNTIIYPTLPEEETEEIQTIAALTDLIEPNWQEEATKSHQGWYLAVDFGTEGLAAVLFNRHKEQIYPLAWISQEGEFCSRLPTEVYCQSSNETQELYCFVGEAAKAKAKEKTGIFLENWKENLNLTSSPANPVREALKSLFSMLIPSEAGAVNREIVEAMGLPEESFRQVLKHLEGAILSCPAGWGEPYKQLLRETVLEIELVQSAERVFFLEEAIATLLAHVSLNCVAQTTVLVINAGAIATELVLADIPEDYRALSNRDFCLESFAYGGSAIDQDILVQLLYPQWASQLNPSIPRLDEEPPQPGEPDLQKRENLRWRLQSHPIGQSFLEAAKLTKMILQQQEAFNARLGNCQWGVKRQDFSEKVVLPYLKRLETAIDSLSIQTGKSAGAIEQVICSGGSMQAVWHVLSPWISEKLPNATIIQNAGATTEPLASATWGQTHDLSFLDRTQTAIGLACLPLFPLILERQ
ncbi:MAG: hypothetical protein IGR93_13070 [Hydrococcus sp. C42_A2020_068]|uniref:hypothetical protein n=1 Tax=Pleurocapsa sp. PCC 7327 TaxID=118163 RepID=UPI00029F9E28|nr:hypothetical protein [Pleurocapsa sp. PCC 7327]AFY79429.1 hypothetical protein Ple7327_4316 [Pleurocapsa sp. PCC 7327]MBF2021003.1 hypothetical protein [Hydrococcus sp. C42_A2020_068]